MLTTIVFFIALFLTAMVLRAMMVNKTHNQTDFQLDTFMMMVCSILWSWLFYLLH